MRKNRSTIHSRNKIIYLHISISFSAITETIGSHKADCQTALEDCSTCQIDPTMFLLLDEVIIVVVVVVVVVVIKIVVVINYRLNFSRIFPFRLIVAGRCFNASWESRPKKLFGN